MRWLWPSVRTAPTRARSCSATRLTPRTCWPTASMAYSRSRSLSQRRPSRGACKSVAARTPRRSSRRRLAARRPAPRRSRAERRRRPGQAEPPGQAPPCSAWTRPRRPGGVRSPIRRTRVATAPASSPTPPIAKRYGAAAVDASINGADNPLLLSPVTSSPATDFAKPFCEGSHAARVEAPHVLEALLLGELPRAGNDRRHGQPEALDPTDQVPAQPLGCLLGQRRDD